jgi:hypothetical protein
LEANVTSTYGLGKGGVAMIWLKVIKLLFFKKSSIVCFSFSLLDNSFSSENLLVFKKLAKHFARSMVGFGR